MLKFISQMFRLRPRRELKELYIFLFFFSFAGSLVAIFEPIFLWQLGFSLSGIALYYAIHYTIYLVIMPLGAQFAGRFGYERSLAVSTPLLIVHFLLLSQLPEYTNLYWIAPGMLALHKIFYWPAYHANFATFSNANNRGTEQSWVMFLSSLSGVIGPAIGGFIAFEFGFPSLFIIAAASLAVAVIAMLRTEDNNGHTDINYGDPWRFMSQPRQRRMVVAMIGWGENLIYLAFWPVYLFVVLGSTASLGLLVSVSMAVAMMFGFGIGELSDKFGARTMLRIFSPLAALTYLARIVLGTTPLAAGIGDFATRLGTMGVQIPFISRLNRSAKSSRNPLLYALTFEMVLSLTKAVLAWVLVAMLPFLATTSAFAFLWAIAATFALLYAVL